MWVGSFTITDITAEALNSHFYYAHISADDGYRAPLLKSTAAAAADHFEATSELYVFNTLDNLRATKRVTSKFIKHSCS